MSRRNKSNRKAKSPSHQLVEEGTTPVKNDTWFFVTCGLIIFAAGLLCWRASNSEIRRAELALSRSEFHEAQRWLKSPYFPNRLRRVGLLWQGWLASPSKIRQRLTSI